MNLMIIKRIFFLYIDYQLCQDERIPIINRYSLCCSKVATVVCKNDVYNRRPCEMSFQCFFYYVFIFMCGYILGECIKFT